MSSHVGRRRRRFYIEKKGRCNKSWGQPHEASWILTFLLSMASPGAYSTYRNAISSLTLFIYACVNCAFCIVFLDDGNMLHGTTIPYITLL
jgi:hypothetical protein